MDNKILDVFKIIATASWVISDNSKRNFKSIVSAFELPHEKTYLCHMRTTKAHRAV